MTINKTINSYAIIAKISSEATSSEATGIPAVTFSITSSAPEILKNLKDIKACFKSCISVVSKQFKQ